MKRYSVLFCLLPLLAGCAILPGKHPHSAAASASKTASKSAANSASITDAGVSGLTASTPMNIAHIAPHLAGGYQLLQGMQTHNGTIMQLIEVRKAGKTALEISGDTHIQRIDVSDPAFRTASGVSVGTAFSKIYQKAYNVCRRAPEESLSGILCQAPDSPHIRYLFRGQWQGSDALLPADDVLKNWTVAKIIWHR